MSRSAAIDCSKRPNSTADWRYIRGYNDYIYIIEDVWKESERLEITCVDLW